MKLDIIRAASEIRPIVSTEELSIAKSQMETRGWAAFRGYQMDIDKFSEIVGQFCTKVTFDPARQNTSKTTQKVDAGLGPIGLHIENGNTPIRPDVVAFYCERAAFSGSQTTVCDGALIYDDFTYQEKELWAQPIAVTRRLSEEIWKRYLVNEHPALSAPEQIRMEHIEQFKQAVPGQDFEMQDDGSLLYSLTINPILKSRFSGELSFANAILGPSHNYEKPTYTRLNGSVISQDEIEAMRARAEKYTVEINWNDGDVVVLDNTRIQHGRRQIVDENRNLFIGMGTV